MMPNTLQIIHLNPSSKTSLFPTKFTNQVYYSSGADMHVAYHSPYSIKFVLKGEEKYTVNGNFFAVPERRFLLVNHESFVECHALGPDAHRSSGLSIFISPSIVSEVCNAMAYSLNQQMENSEPHNLTTPDFLSGIFHREEDYIGSFLDQFSNTLLNQSHLMIGDEFFYRLAETMIKSHREYERQQNDISAVKPATRAELYSRLMTARHFLLDNYYTNYPLESIARVACLSPYHFQRLFKQVFYESPTRFHLKHRLQKAKEDLQSSGLTITETAYKFGFTDVFVFNKMFRKVFGAPPSHFKNLNKSKKISS